MPENHLTIFMLVIYRAVAIACGLAIIYWGYSLLRIAANEHADGRDTASGDRRPALRQVLPGAAFALVGFLILGFSLLRGIEVEPASGRGADSGSEITHAATDTAASSTDAPAMPDSPVPADLPEDITAILKKASAGRELDDSERKVVAEWLTGIERAQASRTDREGGPAGDDRRKKKTVPIPMHRPGEV